MESNLATYGKTAYLIHGFNVSDNGAGTIDKFAPLLKQRGYIVKNVDYGYNFLARVKLCNKNYARFLSEIAEPESLIIGHSNGCAIALLASQMGAPFSQMVFINPALNRNVKIGPEVHDVHVWHSPGDIAVKAASLIPSSIWGDMGAHGYTGDDYRVKNYNKQDNYMISSKSHSDMFEPAKFEFFAPLILNEVQAKYIELRGDLDD